jgi:adenylate kinase family enzyme
VTALILTGPPAAGKNTIAALVAKRFNRCAVIDVDIVRWMVLQPHKAPWDGEEGKAQQRLGVQNTCLLAKSFIGAGFNVILLDVLTDETAHLYTNELKKFELKIVLLLPTLAEIKKRNSIRGKRITDDEVEMLYNWQKHLSVYDTRIDNSDLTAEDAADQIAISDIGFSQ